MSVFKKDKKQNVTYKFKNDLTESECKKYESKKQSVSSQFTRKKPFYKKWWFVLLIIILIAGAGSTLNPVSKTEEDAKSFVPQDNSIIKELTSVGFTDKEADNIKKIFNKSGIEMIDEVVPTIGTGIDELQSFKTVANDTEDLNISFTVEDRELFYIGCWGDDLYDSDKGGTIKKIQDVHIPETEITNYYEIEDIAKEAVKSKLNYPETADFSQGYWGYNRWDNKYSVSGTAVAKNGFGVQSKMFFTVEFTVEDSNVRIDNVSITE